MKEVYLSREIDNEDGYIDDVISDIKSVDQSEELQMLITCIGGDTFQGDRIYRAILEHGGKTTAVVVGCAISMGASILPAFDEVLIDEGAEIMLHKAHIPAAGDNPDTEQTGLIKRFNNKTYKRMLDMGVDESFLSDVFLSDKDENYWLTPVQSEELGIGKVVSADREGLKNQFAIAAKLDISKIKNENSMGLFSKAVPRIVNLSDGRQAMFTSKNEELKKGDSLTLIGSDEKLTGKIMLENNLLAELSATSEVENLEEVEAPANEVTDEMFAELVEQVQGLLAWKEEMMAESTEEMDAKKDNEEMEAKLQAVEAREAEAAAVIAQGKEVIENMAEVASQFKTNFKLDKIEDKREDIQVPVAKLDESLERQIAMKETLNSIERK